MSQLPVRRLQADLLVVGGGTAGCMAAVWAKRQAPACRVVVLEKAQVDRSGCLAAGVNALNAYRRPEDDPAQLVEWVRQDNGGLVREDLVESIARRLPAVPPLLEEWGLSIPRGKKGGDYVFRGPRSIVIRGEGLKPLLAAETRRAGVEVLNRVVATGYLRDGERVVGACGFGVREGVFYVVEAPAVICATGGAAGLYPPPCGGAAHHRTWYSPFNCGTGYAMGIRAGAEMTSFEMRFVPLRVKDVQAPTGTVAQGARVRQVNALGVEYLRGDDRITTADRLERTLREQQAGHGPCYLDLGRLVPEEVRRLCEAYLAMCPSAVLYWADRGIDPQAARLEIAGAEPCLTGGHAQAGYWVDVDRRTTLPGLLAAGDVAGGAPKKYVTGCLAEGQIAAETALSLRPEGRPDRSELEHQVEQEYRRALRPLVEPGPVTPRALEGRLQKIMEEYAGGASRGYRVCESELRVAAELLREARQLAGDLGVADLHGLMAAHEVLDRLEVAAVLVEHLRYRTETRWPIYQSRADFPERDDRRWQCFVNSRREVEGTVALLERRGTSPGGWAPWH
ncbi:MAG: adenylyl-sulfate reductase subunit alpha [Bacillota bacterium]|nr:adenylyl-sulfate reductase subunit alpha [Bacillota bacterium]